MPGLFGSCRTAAPAAGAAVEAACASSGSLRVVPHERLFVSEPEPRRFGNALNPSPGSEESKVWSNGNWLKSRFHFSFAEYTSGPGQFGCLRVMNDDLVQPARGFGTHPHGNMEIITYVVRGSLTHRDSEGNQETLGRGSVQFMTAGTGIEHSEHNLDPSTPLRFIQSWVLPRQRGLRPNYGSMVGDANAENARKNQWSHIVSDVDDKSSKTAVEINQDCNVFVAEIDAGTAVPALAVREGRQAYMLCVEGGFSAASGQQLRQHDGAEVKGPLPLELTAGSEGALVLVFEMASSEHARRDIR